ncbi:hypothetical protein [Plasticicumulans sp.]|uniref:hypothetical protein n=1 Tax=Plasticicumulans sp. TaxID=2307179 RepID=UPI003926B234
MQRFLKIFVRTTLGLLGAGLLLGLVQWVWLIIAGVIEWHGNMKIVLAEIEVGSHVILLNIARAPQESLFFAALAGLWAAFWDRFID